MNNNTLLISYKTLIEVSELNSNIDAKIILPLIKEVQEIRVQPLIGTRLFEKIKQDMTDDALTGDYKQLVDDYIRPVLVYNILTDLPFKLNNRFSNVAVVNRTAEASNQISEADIQKFSDFNKTRARWYGDRLTDYLCANSAKFPEYLESTTKDELPPEIGQYEVGIYLG